MKIACSYFSENLGLLDGSPPWKGASSPSGSRIQKQTRLARQRHWESNKGKKSKISHRREYRLEGKVQDDDDGNDDDDDNVS